MMKRVAVAMAEVAPELARALRAVYRVSRAAGTRAQRGAATMMSDRWTVLALEAGWSRRQIADAASVRLGAITDRARRQRLTRGPVPPLAGVLAVPAAPLSEQLQARLRRQRLIGPAEVARLVGCQPASVRYWAAARGVPFEWTPGGAKRLYDRVAILRAAERRPTEQHPGWRRRKNVAIPPQLRNAPDAPVTRSGSCN